MGKSKRPSWRQLEDGEYREHGKQHHHKETMEYETHSRHKNLWSDGGNEMDVNVMGMTEDDVLGYDDQDVLYDSDDEEIEVEEWLDAEGLEGEMMEGSAAKHYLGEAHEALLRLTHKTNNRGKLMKRPKGADSWN